VLLLTAWLQRSAKPAPLLPTVASTTTVGRLEALVRPHLTWHRAARGGLIAVGAVVLLATGWGVSRALGIGPGASLRSRGIVTEDDRLFVADFDWPANDTSLGVVVTDLLRTEIGRSESIRMLTGDERTRTLTLMRLPTNSRIGPDRAREFAERANAKVYLAGSVTPLGAGYLVRASLFETGSGRELDGFRETATSPDAIIRAVDRLGRDARSRLGASLREVRGSPPLWASVTSSLEAARLYSEGLRLANSGDQGAGLRLLERAVQVDTEFAMAYRNIAQYSSNAGNLERNSWAAERAFRYRGRLPEGLMRFVEGTYYSSTNGWDIEKSNAAYEAVIEASSIFSSSAYNNLGINALRARRLEASYEAFRRGSQIDSTSAFAPVAVIGAMWMTGRKDEARHYVATRFTRLYPARTVHLAQSILASADFKVDSAERLLERLRREDTAASPTQRATILANLAGLQRSQGRLAQAERSRMSAVALARAADTVGGIAPSVLFRATSAWYRDDPRESLRLLDSASRIHPADGRTAEGYRWLELATAYALAGNATKARRLLDEFEQRASQAHKTRERYPLEHARGWIAIAERRYPDAIRAFQSADSGMCLPCALPPLAHAYDLAGQPDSAIAVFERYLATDYWWRHLSAGVFAGNDHTYLAGSYKRLAELYDAKGDTAKAIDYYGRFVDLWKNADPVLQPKVVAARRRMQALGVDARRAR
jgi:tetratricopeptide (TPR) repeat protein